MEDFSKLDTDLIKCLLPVFHSQKFGILFFNSHFQSQNLECIYMGPGSRSSCYIQLVPLLIQALQLKPAPFFVDISPISLDFIYRIHSAGANILWYIGCIWEGDSDPYYYFCPFNLQHIMYTPLQCIACSTSSILSFCLVGHFLLWVVLKVCVMFAFVSP